MTPESCPECGADLDPGARVCPECGSCEETGWSEEAYGSRLNLPGGDFDYDRFIAEEFDDETPRRPVMKRKWMLVGWVLIAVIAIGLLLLVIRPR